MDKRAIVIEDAAAFLSSWLDGRRPVVGIILGSGLGELANEIEDAITIPYIMVPGFPAATAVGHKGNFICGTLGGKCVLAMQGRYHYYEGYPMDTVVLPIRVMIKLGIKYLLVSNAAGAMNKSFSIGDLMLIRDHINLLPNPLIGPNLDDFGPRFPDMTCAYDLELQDRMLSIAAGYPPTKGHLCILHRPHLRDSCRVCLLQGHRRRRCGNERHPRGHSGPPRRHQGSGDVSHYRCRPRSRRRLRHGRKRDRPSGRSRFEKDDWIVQGTDFYPLII